jgi:hypothetical protein
MLLAIERDERCDGRNRFGFKAPFDGYAPEVVAQHFQQLVSGGLIDGTVRHGPKPVYVGLTHQGADCLDAIRDPDVWRYTKDAARAAGGWTLDILKDVATAYIRSKLRTLTGHEV